MPMLPPMSMMVSSDRSSKPGRRLLPFEDLPPQVFGNGKHGLRREVADAAIRKPDGWVFLHQSNTSLPRHDLSQNSPDDVPLGMNDSCF
jgi:hypothetical protein